MFIKGFYLLKQKTSGIVIATIIIAMWFNGEKKIDVIFLALECLGIPQEGCMNTLFSHAARLHLMIWKNFKNLPHVYDEATSVISAGSQTWAFRDFLS